MQQLADFLNGILWSNPLIILALGTGLFFTIATRVLQIRHIKDMVKLLLDGEASEKGLSSFQAFALAISGRVGTGNIAGVATAIALGGPGAVFWMWVLAILGSATAFVECTLAQVYKQEIEGEYRGGVAYYIEKGLNNKFFGAVFAVSITFASAVLLTGVQANAISSSVKNAFGIAPSVSGVVVVILLGAIIFGGVKRLGRAAEIIVPLMAGIYIIIALIVIIVNISMVPEIFSTIVSSAFGSGPVFGGMVGMAINMGVKRGIYSNEAGMGTATQSAAAAEVSHPAKQGLVQAFSVYIDTLFVCTATAFMILITKSYNVIGADGNAIVNHIGDVEMGPVYTQTAVDTVFSFGSAFVAISLFFFAFTTLMNMYYNCETNLAYFFRKGHSKPIITVLRIVYLVCTFYGAIRTAGAAWAYGDVGIGVITWINLVAILLLAKQALKVLKDYEEQKAAGKDPIFDPIKLGIKNADLWIDIAKANKEKAGA